jgi:hypothetical protein
MRYSIINSILKAPFFLFLLLTISVAAQPGYSPIEHLNLNNYSVSVINKVVSKDGGRITYFGDTQEKEYYIDSTTTKFKYLHSLDKIILKLNYIPKALIENGYNLKTIYIQSQHYNSSNNKEEAILHDTLFDIAKLNTLKNLTRININGFYVVSNNDDSNTHNLTDTAKYRKFYGFYDVDIINFPTTLKANGMSFYKTKIRDQRSLKNMSTIKEIWFSGNDIRNIPDYLPQAMEKITMQDCDELNNVENLSLYPNLKSISISDGLHLDTFPKYYSSNSLENVSIQLKPENFSIFLAGFTSVEKINLLNVELYNGIADADFNHLKINIKSLRITGSSLGIKTKIKLSNFEHCEFNDVLLAGTFDEVPIFMAHNQVKNINIYCYDNKLNDNTSKGLWQLKDLEKFALHNFSITKIPEEFFAQNPNLTYLTIEATAIRKLSSGTTVLTQLKQLSIRANKSLVKIPKQKYYPNAYLDSYQNKKQFTRE